MKLTTIDSAKIDVGGVEVGNTVYLSKIGSYISSIGYWALRMKMDFSARHLPIAYIGIGMSVQLATRITRETMLTPLEHAC